MRTDKFTKADIVDAVYEKTKLSRTEIRNTVDIFINEIKEALLSRQVIELRGFGTFEVKIRKARLRARNPKTGESMTVRSHGAVVFRSGRELKQAVWNLNDDNT
jgi:integration host factor subunit beta